MATRVEIDSDLTLEVDGRAVTPEKFLRSVRAFFGIVREVTRDVCGDGEPVHWRVQVKAGSNLVGVSAPVGYPNIAAISAITDRVKRGIETLEARSEEPTWFPRPAIRHLRDLGSIVGTDEDDDTSVRVWAKRDPVGVTHSSVAHAAELLREAFEDHGSIEGRLQVASERGALHAVIYEPIWDKPIKCYLDEDMMEEALSHFGKRVEITGAIKYRSDGSASSIKAEKIVAFPNSDELPKPSDVAGILRNYH